MSKPHPLKARLPRGFADRPAADLAATNEMLAAIRETYELYGFEALETPFVEYTDALGKFLPDQDRPNEGVFSFQDDDEQWLSLRYDLTAPLARHVAAGLDAQTLSLPYRSYRAGWVFRNEKPGPGRFRQFMQFDADTVGSSSVAADAEMCMLMADTLRSVGIHRHDYSIKVSNRKIVEGLLQVVGLSGPDEALRRLQVLRTMDKFDRLGRTGVEQLLGAGRRDESGDITPGAKLSDEQISVILGCLVAPSFSGGHIVISGDDHNDDVVVPRYDIDETLNRVERLAKGNSLMLEGVNELRMMEEIVVASTRWKSSITVDLSVVRGLEYYTGPVYEAELTFPVINEAGETVRFGSVAGGGRYDGLVGRFRAEPVPATGFSIGVSRLLSALQIVKSPVVAGREAAGPVVVLVMDRDRVADYQRMVATLRQAGIRAEMYLGAAGMKAQMKYADRRRAPCVVIQGSQERERGEVQVKDLVEGAERARGETAAASNAEYRSARLAQQSVPEADLVAVVQAVLNRRGM